VCRLGFVWQYVGIMCWMPGGCTKTSLIGVLIALETPYSYSVANWLMNPPLIVPLSYDNTYTQQTHIA
jgi:hypothetical protein